MNVSVSPRAAPGVQQEACAPSSASQAVMYQHLLCALTLLCEFAPYVDEPDYLARLDALLAQASACYPLQWRCEGVYREIAPRAP
jgi:hypothetical protein